MFNKKTILDGLKAVKALALSCSPHIPLKDCFSGNSTVFYFSGGSLTVFVNKESYNLSHLIPLAYDNLSFELCFKADFNAFLAAVNAADALFKIEYLKKSSTAFVGQTLIATQTSAAVNNAPNCTMLKRSFDKAEFVAAVGCMQDVPNKKDGSNQFKGFIVTPNDMYATDRFILLKRQISGLITGEFSDVLPVLAAVTISKIASADSGNADIQYLSNDSDRVALKYKNTYIEFLLIRPMSDFAKMAADILAKTVNASDLGISPKALAANINSMPKSVDKIDIVAKDGVAQCRFSVFSQTTGEDTQMGFDLTFTGEKPYHIRFNPQLLRKGLKSPVISFSFIGDYLGINYADGTQGVLFMLTK
jgi:hypothetical protein